MGLRGTLPGNPQGFLFVSGRPGFSQPTLLVAASGADVIRAYAVNSTGDPTNYNENDPFIFVPSPFGIAVDLQSGDFIVSASGVLYRVSPISSCGVSPDPCSPGFECVSRVCVCDTFSCSNLGGICSSDGSSCCINDFPTICGAGTSTCNSCDTAISSNCVNGRCQW